MFCEFFNFQTRSRTTMILLDYYLFDRTVLVKAEATLA